MDVWRERPHSALFNRSVLCLCVLAFTATCLSQGGQSRHLAYSTYNVKSGDITLSAVNTAGEICVASESELYRLNADGSLIYKEPVQAPHLTAIATDSVGNCYLGFHTTNYGSWFMTISKFDLQGNPLYTFDGFSCFGDSKHHVPGVVASAIGVDGSGNLWITGSTSSPCLQVVNPMPGLEFLKGTTNAIIAELSPAGNLIFSTYFGGSGFDIGEALTTDVDGNVYLVGNTTSNDFPLLNPLEASNPDNGLQNAFLSKIDNAGHLLYSTYLAATVGSNGCGVAIDASEDMFVTAEGSSQSGPYPTIVKLNPEGSKVLYSRTATNLGICSAIAVDSQGNAYTAAGFQPLVNPIQSDTTDAELSGLDPNGNVIFATYLGNWGSRDDDLLPTIFRSIGVDSAGNLYTDAYSYLYNPVPILNAVNGEYPYYSSTSCIPNNCFTQTFVTKIALGAGASFSMPGIVDFPATPVGSNNRIPITIYNSGTTEISISSITVGPFDYFTTSNCPLQPIALSPGTACSISITFSPTTSGTRTATINIDDDSPGNPHSIQLTGIGTAANATLTPFSLSFGSEYVGSTSAIQTLTLQNTANAVLDITNISISGDFAETNTCGNALAAGTSCKIFVTFAPTAAGTRTGLVTIQCDALSGTQLASLTGTGEAPALGLGVAPGSSNSATVTAGTTATFKLTIGGQGMGGTATLTCTGAPRGVACSVPASVAVSMTTASTVTVSVTTSAQIAAESVPPGFRAGWTWAIGFLAMVVLPGIQATKRLRLRKLLFALLLLICSCGGGSRLPTSTMEPGTYTLNITATLGSSSQSVPLTLTVR